MGVGGLISLLILIAIGAMVLYSVTGSALDTAQAQRTSYTDQLLNTSFTDNTGAKPDNWDNTRQGTNIANAWNSSGYVTVTRTDNGTIVDNQENSWWHQALSVGSIYDGISTATVSYKYRVIDNDNAASIVIKVLLDDGTDNTTLLNENVTKSESASWTSGENSVLDNITTTGTYTIHLKTEIIPDNSKEASNIQVGWDDASLSVVTYSKPYMENAITNVEAKGSIVLNLLTILAIVVVAALIIGVVMRAIGGAGGRPTGAPAF